MADRSSRMLTRGDKLAHYTIESLLGSGGMGAVYLALDTRLQRRVALKVILESDKPEDLKESAARLLREARAAASLTHPNVVGVFDVGEVEGRVYLAMEYVVGKTLRELLRDDEAPWQRRLRWLVDVARALAAAHREGLVHRDIKPENVMVREDGIVKVLDFGIARRTAAPVDPTGKTESAHLATLTGKGLVVGTPMYMAPEQLKGGDPDTRTDQFSWGVMSYEVLSGERPWAEKSDLLAAVATILTEDPQSLRKLAPDLPPAVESAIARTLARNPKDRFESMEDVADLLDPLAVRSGATSEARLGSKASRASEPSARPTKRAGRYEDEDDDEVDEAPRTDDHKSTRQAMVTAKSPEHPLAPPPQKRQRRRWPFLAGLAVATVASGVYYKYHKPSGVTPRPTATTSATSPVESANGPPASANPKALAAYQEGLQEWRDGSPRRSRASLELAMSLDPSFAAAELEIAVQVVASGPAARARMLYQKAYSNRERLGPRAAALLGAIDPLVRASADLVEAEKKLHAGASKFPNDPVFELLLGRVRESRYDYEGAQSAYERAIARDASYMPALLGKAREQQLRGNADAALETLGQCIKTSSVAAMCLEQRLFLLRDRGDCKGMEQDARAWQAIDPDTYEPSYYVAAALMARKEPIQSVEVALRRAWDGLPKDERAANEAQDSANLALAQGDFATAERRTNDWVLAQRQDVTARSGPNAQLASIAFETGDLPKAASLADAFLKVAPALTPPPAGNDPTIWAQEYLFRGGKITQTDLDDRRKSWLRDQEANETQQEVRRHAPFRWAELYASFAETADEAKDALAKLNDFLPMPPESNRSAGFEADVGKTYALASDFKEAVPALKRVTGACIALGAPVAQTRSFYYLGMALETQGDIEGAKAAYQTVVDRWGDAKPRSRTAEDAKKRLKQLE
jgi:serine/threonine protein kinase